MASEGFKHIAVTSAEEDDEVVHAGLSALAVGGVPEAPADPSGAEAAQDVPVEPEPEPTPAQDAPSERGAALPSAKDAPSRRAEPLDDLQAGPMPAAQKAVIIAAVICIIGALVYYFVALR